MPPLPSAPKVTPFGNLPASMIVAAGDPVVLTTKDSFLSTSSFVCPKS